jgi:hypothetical protein
MKKLFFIIFLMVFSFAITANAKKPKVVWPKAVLTLKDGTVLNGYLQNDIHFMKCNESSDAVTVCSQAVTVNSDQWCF